MTRTVAGAHLLHDREKEVLRKMIWQVADFCGVDVLTYAIMGNHFHVLARVPHEPVINDEELVRRFAVLYPKPTKNQPLSVKAVAGVLREGGREADILRCQLCRRMGSVSEFMKTLKQRFSVWYNQTHDRFGTLWAERFKSVLVEGAGNPLQTMAAYIDLNPVRAGLVKDPKDYRYCGYAEAVAGAGRACRGYRIVWSDWIGCGVDRSPTEASAFREALRCHRNLLFAKGEHEQVISREAAVKVLEKQRAKLPKATVLRCRVRYFTDGAILGSKAFVSGFTDEWKTEHKRQRPPKVSVLTGCDWGDLAVIQGIRQRIFS